jgi:SAM-dependent methyltransferase/uncharacterized protein YbaR (Trm112 family)
MREGLLHLLRCPSCRVYGALELDVRAHDGREARDGLLRCSSCALERAVSDGVPDLMLDPPPEVVAEADGLERFAQQMLSDGWDRARILRLPHDDSGYWWGQRRSMQHLLETIQFAPGQAILDVGSNTCWAAATFARLGLRTVALDISMTAMQGLRTADWWFDEHEIYFERVLAQMTALPFADGSFDWVFCCEALHHTDRRGMLAALREIRRVLRPGGGLLVVNEPLRWPNDPKHDHGAEVAQFGGNEHVYYLPEYLWATWRAGFRRIRLTEPAFDTFFSRHPLHLTLDASALGSLKLAAVNIVRQRDHLRWAHLAWRYLIGPGVSLHMVCTKD